MRFSPQRLSSLRRGEKASPFFPLLIAWLAQIIPMGQGSLTATLTSFVIETGECIPSLCRVIAWNKSAETRFLLPSEAAPIHGEPGLADE